MPALPRHAAEQAREHARSHADAAVVGPADQPAPHLGQLAHDRVEVHAGPTAHRLPPVEHRAAQPHPGRHQPVDRDVERQHPHPPRLGPHHQRRAARPGRTGLVLLTHQPGGHQLGGQRQGWCCG
ncbi:hypothetical protein [Phytohabitans aurantiacus]|uniref:hypothetical protein n=1 Tax=Phytohabitans aurantiacus TaxID=3016789 RepID=UPI00389A9F10